MNNNLNFVKVGKYDIIKYRSYYMQNCPLAIATKGHLGKDTKHFEKVRHHL